MQRWGLDAAVVGFGSLLAGAGAMQGLLRVVFRALEGCTAVLRATLWADSKAGENQGTPISYELDIALGISGTEPALHSLAIEVGHSRE